MMPVSRSPAHFSCHGDPFPVELPLRCFIGQGRHCGWSSRMDEARPLQNRKKWYGDRRSGDKAEFLGKVCWLKRMVRKLMTVLIHHLIKGGNRSTGLLECVSQEKSRPTKVSLRNRPQMRPKRLSLYTRSRHNHWLAFIDELIKV